MTEFNRSSVNRYVEAYQAGLSDREARSVSDSNRLETVYQNIVRQFGTTWLGREATRDGSGANDATGQQSGDGTVAVVGTLLPASARPKRKPWVVSQLPA